MHASKDIARIDDKCAELCALETREQIVALYIERKIGASYGAAAASAHCLEGKSDMHLIGEMFDELRAECIALSVDLIQIPVLHAYFDEPPKRSRSLYFTR